MRTDGPIIVIEDDEDDQQLLLEAFKYLNCINEIICFADGCKAADYLANACKIPFLILSDINMPNLNGFETRDKIHSNGKSELKQIPYVFFTTTSSQRAVEEAYNGSAQGFFVKPDNYPDLISIVKKIIEYWQECKTPYIRSTTHKTINAHKK